MSLDGPMLNNATAFTTSACECKPDVGWAGTLLPSLTRSGHRRQIKSNGLSEAGSIEKMSADCALGLSLRRDSLIAYPRQDQLLSHARIL